MVRDLIKKDISKLKIKKENVDKILDEAIQETEEFFGRTLKQLPPKGEEHDFLIDLVNILHEEYKEKEKIDELVNEFCKSKKPFKDFMQELSVSGVGGIFSDVSMGGRSGLYDTTRTLVNNGTVSQDYTNLDNDDIDRENVWNIDVKGKEVKNIDISKNVGEKGITKDEYFGKQKKDISDDIYEVTQVVKFKKEGIDDIQVGEIIAFIDSDGEKQAKIRVTTGADSGKFMNISMKNIKDKVKMKVDSLNDGD